MSRVLFLLAAVACAAGCHRGSADAPPCGEIGTRFYALAKDDLLTAKADEATTRAVNDQLPAMRDSLTIACTDGAWSATVRRCLATATTHTDFEACERQLSDDQRRALDRATRGLEPESK